MRILNVDEQPFLELPFQQAGITKRIESEILPMFWAEVDHLPSGLNALILTSDLQGVAPSWWSGGALSLVGSVVAEELAKLSEEGILPAAEEIGVVLAGDLFSTIPPRRGATGDVRHVWLSFAAHFCWVVGVAGNHDEFGYSPREYEKFQRESGIYLLDGNSINVDGLRFGGVSKIIGNPSKVGRRNAVEQLQLLNTVLQSNPDILVFHEGPDVPGTPFKGHPMITQELNSPRELLVVCGHSHWPSPLATLPSGIQVLNVDNRVVILRKR